MQTGRRMERLADARDRHESEWTVEPLKHRLSGGNKERVHVLSGDFSCTTRDKGSESHEKLSLWFGKKPRIRLEIGESTYAYVLLPSSLYSHHPLYSRGHNKKAATRLRLSFIVPASLQALSQQNRAPNLGPSLQLCPVRLQLYD